MSIRHPQCFQWTDERVKAVKKLWGEGLSASLIASRLGGVTRNAVIGKVTRLGLPPRSVSVRKIYKPIHARHPMGKVRLKTTLRPPPMESKPLPPVQVDDVARVALVDLEPHHCRFPVGEPTKGFCGLRKIEGTSYCQGHLQRCTVSSGYVPRVIHSHDSITGNLTPQATTAEFLEPA